MPTINGSARIDRRVRAKGADLEAMVLAKSPAYEKRKESSWLRRFLSYPPQDSLKLRPTSWLDGLRGVAALGVFIFHAMGCWDSLVPAWHSDEHQNSVLQMPILRTFVDSGGAAVSVFFVLSGYVLTQKSLHWMREGSVDQVYPAVASSMFRRGFRLYLPPILLTFCEMLATRIGIFPPLNFDFVPEISLFAQLMNWIADTDKFVNPLHNFQKAFQGFVVHGTYDVVIWTIPIEFYGSFVCYTLLLMLARVPSNTIRMGLIACNACFFMFVGSWNNFCFLAGMLIADLHLGQVEDGVFKPSKHSLIWAAVFAMAFYTAGFPTLVTDGAKVKPMPGFETLRKLTPTRLNMQDHARFWWSISGVSLLFSVSQLPRVKTVFETRFCQYLGRIAFSLYLVHEFCIVLFGLKLQAIMLKVAGMESKSLQPPPHTIGYWFLCAVWFMLFTLPVFAVAARIERLVDRPSVQFAKWLERKWFKVFQGR